MHSTHRNARFWLASAAVAAFLAWFVFALAPVLRIETNLLALLPATAENRVQLGAVRRFADRSSRELVFVVGIESREQLRATGLAFADSLQNSGAFAAVDYLVDDRHLAAVRAEKSLRTSVLSRHHRELLLRGDVTALEREALRAAFTPLGFPRPFGIAEDPLGLASAAFVESLPAAGTARLEGDIMVVSDAGRHWTVVRATANSDPYRTETQEAVTQAIDTARSAALGVDASARVDGSGVILHVAQATSQARAEIATFGTIDLIAVLLLIVLVFRLLRPLVFTLVTLGLATCAAIAACQLVFGNVHVLTLTFGTSLIGVSVDYSLHYFVNKMRDGELPPHNIVPALILGCITAVCGYLALLIAPIPGLRQIALFSAVGLVVACSIVVVIYPGLDRWPMTRAVPSWVVRLAELRVAGLLPRDAWWITCMAALLLTAWGIAQLTPRDDIRALQKPSAGLVAADARVRALLGLGFDSRFVLVTAPTPEQLLQRLESLAPVLAGLQEKRQINAYMSVSQSLPSQALQASNRALLESQVFGPDGALERIMRRLGFAAQASETRRADFLAADGRFLTPEHWLASPLSAPVRHLWLGLLDDQHAAAVLFDGNPSAETMSSAVQAVPGVRFVDQAADVSDVLGRYRHIASLLILAVIGVMFGVLLMFYRSRAAVFTAAPAAVGIAVTLAILGFAQVPINLFHILSLLLVLGLGVDYAIILREGSNHRAVLAVFLSMMATLISFGLLSFSSVAFVRSIGITVAIGVACTFFIALASRQRTPRLP